MSDDITFPASGQFLGKIAILGSGGAGKTRMVVELVNSLTGNKFPWSEESNMGGTINVTPYPIQFPSPRSKVIIVDNPGQDSLETIRVTTARVGSQYSGIIIVLDSCAWNFRQLAIGHAAEISKYMDFQQSIPVNIITNKSDLAGMLTNGLADRIAQLLEQHLQLLLPQQQIEFHNRVKKVKESFSIRIDDGWIPFSQIEQFFVNVLDRSFSSSTNLPGLTPMNIRLLIRSLLLGFCEYYRQFHPDSLHHPIFNSIDDNLVNALNYFRPTTFEMNVNWFQMTRTTQKYEVPFHVSAFSSANVMFVFQNYVLAKLYQHTEFVRELRERHPNWDIIDAPYTSSITFDGLGVIRESIGRLLTQIKHLKDQRGAPMKRTPGSLGLDRF